MNNNSPFRHNFIFVHGSADYYRIACSDLESRDDVRLIFEYGMDFLSLFQRKKLRIQKSSTLDKFIDAPFSPRFQETFRNIKFKDNSKSLCFVINVGIITARFGIHFLEYLHKEYPKAKFVGFYVDLIRTKRKVSYPQFVAKYFNLLISYDKTDCEKYKLTYYPTFFSRYNVSRDMNIPESDLYFCGAAKNRFLRILSIYKECKSAGLKCDFYIAGLKKSKQVNESGLHYIERMSYKENLKHAVKAKCLLEIIQQGACSSTFRQWEAIRYNKAILTNNSEIIESVFYDPRYVCLLSNDDRVNTDFIKNYIPYENPLKEQISPLKFLEFIETKIE